MQNLCGWQFPPKFYKSTGSVAMVDGFADIAESLRILFSTLPGERFLDKYYGCDLEQYLFETQDDELLGEIQAQIGHAIKCFEPRVKINAINTSFKKNGIVHVHLALTTDENRKIEQKLSFQYSLETGQWWY